MNYTERLKLHPEIALWHAASGKPGKRPWWIVRETPKGLEPYEDKRGRVVGFASRSAALKKSAALRLP